MFEEQPQQTTYFAASLRTGIAITFFILAVPLGVWVLTTVKTTLDNTKTPAILQKICSEDTKSFIINTPNGRVELPPQVFKGFPYMILFMFLLIPTSITVALLKGGVALLNPNLTRQLRQLINSLQKPFPPQQG
jgi:hypothetical protein